MDHNSRAASREPGEREESVEDINQDMLNNESQPNLMKAPELPPELGIPTTERPQPPTPMPSSPQSLSPPQTPEILHATREVLTHPVTPPQGLGSGGPGEEQHGDQGDVGANKHKAGQQWKSMTEEQRQPYRDMASRAREFKERQRQTDESRRRRRGGGRHSLTRVDGGDVAKEHRHRRGHLPAQLQGASGGNRHCRTYTAPGTMDPAGNRRPPTGDSRKERTGDHQHRLGLATPIKDGECDELMDDNEVSDVSQKHQPLTQARDSGSGVVESSKSAAPGPQDVNRPESGDGVSGAAAKTTTNAAADVGDGDLRAPSTPDAQDSNDEETANHRPHGRTPGTQSRQANQENMCPVCSRNHRRGEHKRSRPSTDADDHNEEEQDDQDDQDDQDRSEDESKECDDDVRKEASETSFESDDSGDEEMDSEGDSRSNSASRDGHDQQVQRRKRDATPQATRRKRVPVPPSAAARTKRRTAAAARAPARSVSRARARRAPKRKLATVQNRGRKKPRMAQEPHAHGAMRARTTEKPRGSPRARAQNGTPRRRK